jgi:LytS/YehU family sensor histidine kinase
LISGLTRGHSIEFYLAPIGVGMMFWVFAFGHMILRQYNETINELQNQKIKNLKLAETNLQSQLSILKKQLDPHFLFNSLGTLVALVETDADLAVEYIEEFSNVYRYIIDTKDMDFVPLTKELEFCSAYLYLIQIRFEGSIEISQNVEDGYKNMLIPPLSLQMLLENAIKHNIATPNKKLYIEIKNERNQLVVTNNIQIKKQAKASSKLGLKNLNQRLHLLKQLRIVVSESDNNFIVKIPLIKEV